MLRAKRQPEIPACPSTHNKKNIPPYYKNTNESLLSETQPTEPRQKSPSPITQKKHKKEMLTAKCQITNENQCSNTTSNISKNSGPLTIKQYRQLIEKQQIRNNELKGQIQEMQSKHQKRMIKINRHLEKINKQYLGYEKELEVLALQMDEFGL